MRNKKYFQEIKNKFKVILSKVYKISVNEFIKCFNLMGMVYLRSEFQPVLITSNLLLHTVKIFSRYLRI
jgi:hypothetical protein